MVFGTAQANDEPLEGAPEQVFTRVEFKRHQPERVELNDDWLIYLPEDGSPTPVRVALTRSWCTYTVEWISQGQTRRRSDRGTAQPDYLYELRGRDRDVPYVWATHTCSPIHQVKLFAHGPGENYLVFVTGPTVIVHEVTRTRDPYEATRALYEPVDWAEDTIASVNRLDIRFEGHFRPDPWRTDGEVLKEDWGLRVIALDRNSEGKLEMKVHGVDPTRVFTLVAENGRIWKRKYGENEE